MKNIRLGATALEISEIGFGGIPIIPLPQEEAVSVVRHCFDLGITFFDTANMYPTSEAKLGIALKSIRNKVAIATKSAQRDAKGAAEHIDLSLRQSQTTGSTFTSSITYPMKRLSIECLLPRAPTRPSSKPVMLEKSVLLEFRLTALRLQWKR
jgi:aryl-alcohol dehydrogenase-like predicted oxidoreductase